MPRASAQVLIDPVLDPVDAERGRVDDVVVDTLPPVADAPILHLSLPIDDLDSARTFYVDVLGCRLGRVRDDWLDIWFFGLQLTLQRCPNEVTAADQQGVRHFGVVLRSKQQFEDLVARVNAAGIMWIVPPGAHSDPTLSGKVGGKLADPSGNVIELKHYDDVDQLLRSSEAGEQR